MLEIERKFIKEHHLELQKQYPDKYLVIKGEEVRQACDTKEEAIDWGVGNLHGTGGFLVRSVNEPDDPRYFVSAFHRGWPSIGVS